MGIGSDNDLAKFIMITPEEKEELLEQMGKSLDTRRYCTVISRQEGRISPRWRQSEKQDHRKRLIEVGQIFRANNRKRIPNSCSSAISRWKGESIDKIALWQLWHRLWLYSEKSPRILPRNMLLPSEAIPPRKKRSKAQVRREARGSEDVPSTDDENVVSDGSMDQDFIIDTSSDESVWSM